MFHFWFNTFFITDEETATLDECSATEVYGDGMTPTTTKMCVTRTQSDQTRVVDRIVAEQRRLHRQLNNELLSIARRVESSDHLNLPKTDLSRPKSPPSQFYMAGQTPQPRTYKVLRLCKCDIDRANKDKQHRLYPPEFAVSSVIFSFKSFSSFSFSICFSFISVLFLEIC